MDKDKIIKVLESLPQEFYETAYSFTIDGESPHRFKFQMKYNTKLCKVLMDANRWRYEFDGNGFMEFIRDDNVKITMT